MLYAILTVKTLIRTSIICLTNASVSFEKQTKSDGSIIIRVGIDDKEKAETIMNAKKVVL